MQAIPMKSLYRLYESVITTTTKLLRIYKRKHFGSVCMPEIRIKTFIRLKIQVALQFHCTPYRVHISINYVKVRFHEVIP